MRGVGPLFAGKRKEDSAASGSTITSFFQRAQTPVTGTLNIATTCVSGGSGAGTSDDGAGDGEAGDSVRVRLGKGPSWTAAMWTLSRQMFEKSVQILSKNKMKCPGRCVQLSFAVKKRQSGQTTRMRWKEQNIF